MNLMCNSEFKNDCNESGKNNTNQFTSLERNKFEDHKRFKSADANMNSFKSKRPSILDLMNQKKLISSTDNNQSDTIIADETKSDELKNDIKSNKPESEPNDNYKVIVNVELNENNVSSKLDIKTISSNGSDDIKIDQVSTNESLNNQTLNNQNETNSKLLNIHNESMISKDNNSFLNNTYNQSNP